MTIHYLVKFEEGMHSVCEEKLLKSYWIKHLHELKILVSDRVNVKSHGDFGITYFTQSEQFIPNPNVLIPWEFDNIKHQVEASIAQLAKNWECNFCDLYMQVFDMDGDFVIVDSKIGYTDEYAYYYDDTDTHHYIYEQRCEGQCIVITKPSHM